MLHIKCFSWFSSPADHSPLMVKGDDNKREGTEKKNRLKFSLFFFLLLILPQVLFEVENFCFYTCLLFFGIDFVFGVVQNHTVVHIGFAYEVGRV